MGERGVRNAKVVSSNLIASTLAKCLLARDLAFARRRSLAVGKQGLDRRIAMVGLLARQHPKQRAAEGMVRTRGDVVLRLDGQEPRAVSVVDGVIRFRLPGTPPSSGEIGQSPAAVPSLRHAEVLVPWGPVLCCVTGRIRRRRDGATCPS